MLVSRPNPVFDRPPRPLQRTRRRLLGHRYSRAVAINRQAIVLSFAGGTPYSPRAQRARMVATALEELLACPVERVPPAGRPYAVDDGSRQRRPCSGRPGRSWSRTSSSTSASPWPAARSATGSLPGSGR